MNMHLIYIDESHDQKTHFAYSAVFVPAFEWNAYFDHVLQWRREWFAQHGILLEYELHATDFTGGRKKPDNKNRDYRAGLFYEALGRIEKMDGIQAINAITQSKKQNMELFECMLIQINRTLEVSDSLGILICDEGNEGKIVPTVRRMQKENIIQGKNVPLTRIIEDPLFKTSDSSYFIQLSDFLAFALLRNENPVPDSTREPVQKAFEQLDRVLVKSASTADPRKKGIIRV